MGAVRRRRRTAPGAAFGPGRRAAFKAALAVLGGVGTGMSGGAHWTRRGIGKNTRVGQKFRAKRKMKRTRSRYAVSRGSGNRSDIQKEVRRSHVTIPMGPRVGRRFMRTFGRVLYEVQDTGTIVNLEGKQKSADLVTLFDTQMFETGASPRVALWKLNPHAEWGAVADTGDANPIAVYPSAPVTASGVINAGDNRMYIRWVKSDVTFVNLTVLPTTVTVYFTTPNTSGSKLFVDMWKEMIALEAYPAGTGTRYPTLANSYAPFTGQPSVDDYGAVPWRSKDLKRFWRVKRQITFELAAGASHKFTVYTPYNRMVDEQFVHEHANRSIPFMRGLTWQMSATIRSSLVESTYQPNAGTETAQGVTYGIGKIGWVASHQMCLEFPQTSPNIQLITPQVIANATLGDQGGGNVLRERIINEIDALQDVNVGQAP